MNVYLDYNATTPVDPAVVEAMLPFLKENFGNAGSVHTPGQRARAAVDAARASVAALIGAQPKEIVFTSGGTEADNLAIFGSIASFARSAGGAKNASAKDTNSAKNAGSGRAASAAKYASGAESASGTSAGGGAAAEKARKHVITSAIDHHAVLHACEELERRGIDVTYIPVSHARESQGLVDPEDVRRAIRTETVLITIMHANNELGVIQPIEEIGRIAREAGVRFHCDAVQSAGKVPLDVNRLGVDLLSISAHKFYGPKGVGALYVREGTALEPLVRGGHAERDRRPGTENVPGIVAIGKAAELSRKLLAEEMTRIGALRDRLEAALLERIPRASVNGDRRHRVPNTLNLTFAGAGGEAMVISLDLQGIACSTGAACSSGSTEPSHVLIAAGLSYDDARSSLRLSLGRPTTAAEIDYAIEKIPAVVERLRALSPREQNSPASVASAR
jgi:cysteine desulfurase